VLTVSAAVHYALPEWQTIADVTKSYPYQHSVFERVDNLNNEERALASALDAMPEIAWWQRNANRGQFALKGWHPHTFNPDFLAKLTNGVDVLLEYKGADRATDDQTRWKDELGSVWESLDSKKRFFRIVTRANLDTVVAELKAEVRA
jgi:type III restriction enzyme